MDRKQLLTELNSLVVFRHVGNTAVLRTLKEFLGQKDKTYKQVAAYSDFISALYEETFNFSDYILNVLCEDENQYVQLVANGKEIPAVLQQAVDHELDVLQDLTSLSAKKLISLMDYNGYLPEFESTEFDLKEKYKEYLAEIHKRGYGIYARNIMFRLTDEGITPVASPDDTTVDMLFGYEQQRQKVIDNTWALLKGKPAANTLLYGDAGTGKSSSVKAVTNLLAGEGLRLVEMRKDQLWQIPYVMEQLHKNPLKFIIFIDDLSFSADDDNFSMLKAILEGSASAKAPNTVIYATSNRRHLVKESFSDRDGDDIHRNDTMQELLSLSNRFGLTILYTRPDQFLFLDIVHELAKAANIEMDQEELDKQAAAFAIRNGGRSPRVAKHFVNSLAAQQ